MPVKVYSSRFNSSIDNPDPLSRLYSFEYSIAYSSAGYNPVFIYGNFSSETAYIPSETSIHHDEPHSSHNAITVALKFIFQFFHTLTPLNHIIKNLSRNHHHSIPQ